MKYWFLAAALVVAQMGCGEVCELEEATSEHRYELSCATWAGEGADDLERFIRDHECTLIPEGIHELDHQVIVTRSNRLIRGASRDDSVLIATGKYPLSAHDALIGVHDPNVTGIVVENLTLDAAGRASYVIGHRNITVRGSNLVRGRCTGVGIAGFGMRIEDNLLENNGLDCAAVPPGVAEGAGIYSESKAWCLAPVITGNTIRHSIGPALDINGTWCGTFSHNWVEYNSAWAAVSLYGASHWTIEDNHISHPPDEPGQPYHEYCDGVSAPGSGASAAIFLCQDLDADGLWTTHNEIRRNDASSYYGILSIGADELHPYWAPRNNRFIDNNVFGSNVGCADDFRPGQWFNDRNHWEDNNCAGYPDSGPQTF